MTDDDALLSVVREQNRDMREIAKDLSSLAAILARHTALLDERAPIVAEHREAIKKLSDRVSALESVSWKPITAIVAVVMGVMVIALYLVAGGDPEGVKDLLP